MVSENSAYEESPARYLFVSVWVRQQEASCSASAVASASTRCPPSSSQPDAAGECSDYGALRDREAGKCQYSHLQLLTGDHQDRFQDRAHSSGLQENERGKMKRGVPRKGSRPDAVTSQREQNQLLRFSLRSR
jgi:hypothetical protein